MVVNYVGHMVCTDAPQAWCVPTPPVCFSSSFDKSPIHGLLCAITSSLHIVSEYTALQYPTLTRTHIQTPMWVERRCTCTRPACSVVDASLLSQAGTGKSLQLL